MKLLSRIASSITHALDAVDTGMSAVNRTARTIDKSIGIAEANVDNSLDSELAEAEAEFQQLLTASDVDVETINARRIALGFAPRLAIPTPSK